MKEANKKQQKKLEEYRNKNKHIWGHKCDECDNWFTKTGVLRHKFQFHRSLSR